MYPHDEDEDDGVEGKNASELLFLLDRQRDLITSVATGQPITSVLTAKYKLRLRKLKTGLKRLGIENPYPWPDLYQWWAHCKRLGTYQERRNLVARISEPIVQQLEAAAGNDLTDWDEDAEAPEGWEGLQQRVQGLREEFATARTLDDWQDVGRRSREVAIDLANLVFVDSKVPDGEEPAKMGDATRRLDFYIASRIPGATHEKLRNLLRSAWALANSVTHSSTVARAEAYAAAQAAILLVGTLRHLERPDER